MKCSPYLATNPIDILAKYPKQCVICLTESLNTLVFVFTLPCVTYKARELPQLGWPIKLGNIMPAYTLNIGLALCRRSYNIYSYIFIDKIGINYKELSLTLELSVLQSAASQLYAWESTILLKYPFHSCPMRMDSKL